MMVLSAGVMGLILNFAGSIILMIVIFFGCEHQKIYTNPWHKKYRWLGWRPFLKISHPSGKIERKIKWTHKVIVECCIPPVHLWNAVGFLYMSAGFFLQLWGLINTS